MMEVTSGEVKVIDFLVGELDEWKKEVETAEGLVRHEGKIHTEFDSISRKLNDILPKLEDESLFEIDDILYPDQKWSDYQTSRRLLHTKDLFQRTDMSIYLSAYYFEAYEWYMDDNILHDYTLLKVVQHLPEYGSDLHRILRKLLFSRNERAVCFGLKFFKTLLKGKFANDMQGEEYCSMVSSFRDIPISKDPINQKIASFIAKLAKECFEKFDKEYIFPEENLPPETKITSTIHYLLKYFDYNMQIYQRNILYNEFTSAKDEETKRKYLKWIVDAIGTSCLKYMFKGFKVFTNCLLWRTINSESHIIDDIMRLIDVQCGRRIEVYLPDVDVPIDSKKMWEDEENEDEKNEDEKNEDEKNEDEKNEDEENEDEIDYTFEKFFFYDEVMKNLHLLKIIYAAAAEHGEYDDKDYTEAFRDNKFIFKDVGYYLINENVKVPWYLEKTLEMCPFLIFPQKHKELVFNLIRVLRREEEVPKSEKLSRIITKIKNCYNKKWEARVPKFPILPDEPHLQC